MAKQKSIVLAYARLGNTYEVQEIHNSALLNPGDWINPAYCKALCDAPDWEVTVIPLHVNMPINPVEILAPVIGAL